MLKKLILTNWKSHKNNTIEFNKGHNLFVGNIGSGKTSIFDAIVFALFGSTPNINSRKILAKDVIMSKPLEENEAQVILEFEIDNNNYRVERTVFKNKSSQAKLYLDEKLIRGPKPSDVNDEIENILKINIDLFMKANYAEQNAIDYFLKLPAGERKNLFDNIFGISKYDNYANNAKQSYNKLKIKLDELLTKKSEYNSLISNYNIMEINKKINELRESNNKIISELKESNEKLKELKEKEQIILKEKTDFETISNAINNLLGKESYLEKIISETKIDFNITELNTKILDLKEKNDKIKTELNNLNEELNNLKTKSYFYKNKLQELNTKKEELLKLKEILANIPEDINNIVNKFVSKIDLKKEEFNKNNEQIKNIEQELDILSKEHSKCPLCDSALSKEHKTEIIFNKNNDLKKLKELLKDIVIEINNLKQEYERKNKQRETYNKNIEYFKILKTESLDVENYTKLLYNNSELEKKYSEKYNSLKQNFEKTSEEIITINTNKNKIEDLELKQKDLVETKTKLTELKNKLKTINYLPENYLKIKEEIQKIISETTFKNTLKQEKEKQINEENFKLEQYNKINEKQILNNKEIDVLKIFLEDLIIYSNIAKKTQEQIREQIVSSVNEIFMDLWQNIYPYKDFQKVRFNISDGDYKIEIEFDKEYKRELDEFVSGGERSAIALTLRIAMSLVMKNKLNLIVLDEPTHNLDKSTILKLSELFNNYLPKLIDQIFVITHDTNLEEDAENIFYIQRNKEEDTPSEIIIK